MAIMHKRNHLNTKTVTPQNLRNANHEHLWLAQPPSRLRSFTARKLSKFGYRVTEVESELTTEVWDRKAKSQPSLLIIEADMHQPSGLYLTKRLKKRWPNIPTIVLCNDPQKIPVEEAAELPNTEIFINHFDLVYLNLAIRKSLNRKSGNCDR